MVALAGDDTTVKSYFPNDGKIELRPSNVKYKTQIYEPEDIAIQGKVIGLQRSMIT